MIAIPTANDVESKGRNGKIKLVLSYIQTFVYVLMIGSLVVCDLLTSTCLERK